MSRVMNDRDMVFKTVVPSTASSSTDPSSGDLISGCSHIVSTRKKAHVIGITVAGSTAGKFALRVNGVNVYPLRVAANGLVRVMFNYGVFTATSGQSVQIIAGEDLTGDYEACMEIYEEEVTFGS